MTMVTGGAAVAKVESDPRESFSQCLRGGGGAKANSSNCLLLCAFALAAVNRQEKYDMKSRQLQLLSAFALLWWKDNEYKT